MRMSDTDTRSNRTARSRKNSQRIWEFPSRVRQPGYREDCSTRQKWDLEPRLLPQDLHAAYSLSPSQPGIGLEGFLPTT